MEKQSFGKRLLAFALTVLLICGSFTYMQPQCVNADTIYATRAGSLVMKKGKTKILQTSLSGTKAWASNNTKVVKIVKTVSSGDVSQCTIKGVGIGSTQVFLRVTDSSGFYKYYAFEVTVTGKKIALNKKKMTLTAGGVKGKLTLSNAKASKVKWSSSKKSVAAVSKKGVVTPKKAGSAVITAKYKSKSYKCRVTVKGASSTNGTSGSNGTNGTSSSNDANGTNGTNNETGGSGSNDGTGSGFGGTSVPATTGAGKIVTTASAPEEAAIAGKDSGASIKTVNTDGGTIQVDIPAGAFDTDTEVKVVQKDGMVDISVDGKDSVMLQEYATVKIELPEKVVDKDLDYYVPVYYYNGQEYYMDADQAQLKNGIMEFQTYHFSWFWAKKLTDEELDAKTAHEKAVKDAAVEMSLDLMQQGIDKAVGEALTKLGISESSKAYSEITRNMAKSAAFVQLYQSGKEGDLAAFLQKATEITIQTLAENPAYLKMTKVNLVSSVVGNTVTMYDAIKEGKYTEAVTAVLKTFSDTLPPVKYTKLAAAGYNIIIDQGMKYDVECAYKLYAGLVREGEHGLTLVDGADGWARVQGQMETTINQMVIRRAEAWAEQNGTTYNRMTAEQKAGIRSEVIDSLKKNLEYRYKNEKLVTQKEARNKELQSYFEEDGLLVRGMYDFSDDDDRALRLERLINLQDSIRAMIGEDNLYKAFGTRDSSKQDYYIAGLVREWVEAGWGKKGGGPAGREAVAKKLAEKFGYYLDGEPEIKLSAEILTLDNVGDMVQLTLENAEAAKVTWKSGNTKVATVDELGNVKGIDVGTATIIATFNGKSYKCEVTVGSDNPIAISPKSLSLKIGETSTLTLENGKEANAGPWTSGDSSIASVESNGMTAKVTGKGAGTTKISIEYQYADGSKQVFACNVMVEPAPVAEGVHLSETAITLGRNLAVGQKASYTLKLLDKDGNEITEGVTWTLGHIASFDQDAFTLQGSTVTYKVLLRSEFSVAAGFPATAVVTATYNGQSYECDVSGRTYTGDDMVPDDMIFDVIVTD